MHELKRRSYLDSMGIDSYISRGQLPGAAPTQRLVINRRTAVPAIGAATPAVTGATPTESNAATAFREAANTVQAQLGGGKTQSAPPAAERAPAVAVPRFSIVAVIAGGFLWLEELSATSVSRDQVHLIRAIVKALALNDGELDVSQFDWPIHSNTQLDLGEDAARTCLGSFVQRKADGGKCRGMILMGSGCREKLDMAQFESVACLS
ncbi:MAG: hypothetical protein IMF06_03660, partial [Proteobacteria bacterium]|nr:hypothetical protein [Pseudomonadota bacterium]